MTLGTIIALLGLTIITVRRNPVTAVTAKFDRLRRKP
jgi:hypothetical protein